MQYYQKIILKNGKEAVLRNGIAADGPAVFANFQETHGETDFLLTYPEETAFGPAEEGAFLEKRSASPNAIEILALVEGKVVGTAGIEAVGDKEKLRHRAEFGVSVSKDYWGLGIGKALTEACIHCAQEAGYVQLELNVVAENERALRLYRRAGFAEFGRNPRGFLSRTGKYQEVVYMLLPL